MSIIISIVWLIPCLMLTQATWTTVMRSAHHKNTTRVTQMDNTIVTSSFISVTWLNCAQRCTRLEGILSLYYEITEQTCYCNKEEDANTIAGTNGTIMYTQLMTKLDAQVEDGKQHYVLSEGFYTNCAEIYTAGYRLSGSYVIRNSHGTNTAEIYCNMAYADWTVFQRRYDGSVDFYRDWNAYKNGFGSPSGEFWLGLETLYQVTNFRDCELLILMEAESDNPIQATGYARYDVFSVGSNATRYVLEVKSFSGDVGDALAVHNGMMFSTYDADNDVTSTDCAERYHGAWWYVKCHSSNLNGRYLAGDHSTYGDGMIWRQTWGYYYSLLKTEMMYKCD